VRPVVDGGHVIARCHRCNRCGDPLTHPKMSAQVPVDSSEGVLVPLNPSAAEVSAVPAGMVAPLISAPGATIAWMIFGPKPPSGGSRAERSRPMREAPT
jgi:hypothetical protein